MSKKAIKYLQEAYETSYEMDDDGDVDVETAKSMIAVYLDRCIEEAVKEIGSDYGLDDIGPDAQEQVQDRIEEIASKLKRYLKSGNLPIR
jgi:hypothetical protein